MAKKKLLRKTTNSFLAYSVVTLLVAAPVFYFISSWLYVYEADEVLLFHKNAFQTQSRNYTFDDIAVWNKYSLNVKIVPDMGVLEDSIVSKKLFEKAAGELEPFRILYAPVEINGKRYTYVEESNLVEMEGMVFSIATMFLVIIIILLVGIIWISKSSAAKIWKPFYDTLAQIQSFEIDKNKAPNFAATDIDEFDRLNKSLDRLIEKNTEIYRTQREFVENAAHELQTPLALFQGKIESLFQTKGLSDEQSKLLDSLNNDVGRLNRLNKNLLLLSKIENENYLEKQTVSINDVIERNLEFFLEQAKSKNIVISTLFDKHLTIEANPALTETLLNNLFLNAIRHNFENGKIDVVISKKTISFKNSGIENRLDAEKVFNRFSKVDSSSQGNGLGLAIVKKISDLNGWKIRYEFENNLHNFIVTFA